MPIPEESGVSHPPIDCTYDLRCQSDALRVTKNNRVYGIGCCPVTEMKVALILSDSRLLVWEFKTVDYQVEKHFLSSQAHGFLMEF